MSARTTRMIQHHAQNSPPQQTWRVAVFPCLRSRPKSIQPEDQLVNLTRLRIRLFPKLKVHVPVTHKIQVCFFHVDEQQLPSLATPVQTQQHAFQFQRRSSREEVMLSLSPFFSKITRHMSTSDHGTSFEPLFVSSWCSPNHTSRSLLN